jgi:hypothetical protein
MRRVRVHLSFANVCSFLALVVALGTGVAYAANTIASEDIINGEVKTADLAANAVNSSKIADGQVTEADIAQGAVTTNELKNDAVTSQKVLNETLVGNDVAANALKGADIDEATLDIGDTARAYAAVNAFDCVGSPTVCSPEQSKGITSVTRTSVGRYCVIAAGIDGGVAPAAVTVDLSNTNFPQGNASAMTQEAASCGASGDGFLVATHRQPQAVVDAENGGSSVVVSGPAGNADDVSFTIVIP